MLFLSSPIRRKLRSTPPRSASLLLHNSSLRATPNLAFRRPTILKDLRVTYSSSRTSSRTAPDVLPLLSYPAGTRRPCPAEATPRHLLSTQATTTSRNNMSSLPTFSTNDLRSASIDYKRDHEQKKWAHGVARGPGMGPDHHGRPAKPMSR